jgi:hypothetical protein
MGLSFLASCDDPIDIELDKGPERLVVDAWLHHNITSGDVAPDTIKLRWTAPYFESAPAPKASGALVVLSDNTGLSDTLPEVSPGNYITVKTIREPGRSYKLYIRIRGEEYEGFAELRPVPPIDSLKAIFEPKSRPPRDSGFYLFYYGPETPGSGDFYRFKTYVNRKLLNKASDLAFTSDQFLREVVYIDSLEINFLPFDRGDTVKVETLSITEDNFYFFTELQGQINNGGLFAQPPANVRCNVKNKNPKGPPAQGYFGASGVSWAEIICR